MDFNELLKHGNTVSVTITAQELADFARQVAEAAVRHFAPKQDNLLTQQEACKMLHTTTNTLFRWRNQGLIKAIKVGRSVQYSKPDLEEFLLKRQQQQAL